MVGTWCILPSAASANVVAKAGLDFIIIDMEHGAMNFETALGMVMAAQTEGCSAIIRVMRNDESLVLRALETGADGVMVPHIEKVSEAVAFASYAKYPPEGKRGFSPYARACGYCSSEGVTKKQNKKVLTAILLEDAEAIKMAGDFALQKGVDAVYIGTYDLSSSLGVPGKTNDSKVLVILKEAVAKIRKAGKVAGCMAHNPEEIKILKAMGVNLILYSVDTFALFSHFEKITTKA